MDNRGMPKTLNPKPAPEDDIVNFAGPPPFQARILDCSVCGAPHIVPLEELGPVSCKKHRGRS